MNIYVVVEGEVGEKRVYEKWIPFVNSNLAYAPTIGDVVANNFYIAIGGGYPNIFEIIEAGIDDVNSIKDGEFCLFDRLVIAIDSENDSLDSKKKEIEDCVNPILLQKNITIDYRVIVQHFCLETWALGNRKIFTHNIRKPELIKYKNIFNVATRDPELLPPLPDEGLNRAQFATKYLTYLLNNKYRNCSYSKSNPDVLLPESYFTQVKNRLSDTGHINSFNAFLEAFA